MLGRIYIRATGLNCRVEILGYRGGCIYAREEHRSYFPKTFVLEDGEDAGNATPVSEVVKLMPNIDGKLYERTFVTYRDGVDVEFTYEYLKFDIRMGTWSYTYEIPDQYAKLHEAQEMILLGVLKDLQPKQIIQMLQKLGYDTRLKLTRTYIGGYIPSEGKSFDEFLKSVIIRTSKSSEGPRMIKLPRKVNNNLGVNE